MPSKRRQTYIRDYLYLIRSKRAVKIGISHFPLSRFDNISRVEKDRPLQMLACVMLACVMLVNAYSIEQTLHAKYKNERIHGEWFVLTEDQILDLIEMFYNLEKSTKLQSIRTL